MSPKGIVTTGFSITGVVAFFIFREVFAVLWDILRLPVLNEWVLSLPDIVSIGSAIVVFLVLNNNQAATTFVTEVVHELFKVTWPMKKETVVSTGVVAVMVGIASLILVLFDSVWGTVTKKFLVY